MNIIFTGPPLAGKGIQAMLLGKKLAVPVFSIGRMLREKQKAGYAQYAMKGKNLPTQLKFNLLREKLDKAKNGFILENFPATKDDLVVFLDYLGRYSLSIDKVFNIIISEDVAQKRMKIRKRMDDTPDILHKRTILQGRDRKRVLAYFKEKGLLVDIDGQGSINQVHKKIMENLSL